MIELYKRYSMIELYKRYSMETGNKEKNWKVTEKDHSNFDGNRLVTA